MQGRSAECRPSQARADVGEETSSLEDYGTLGPVGAPTCLRERPGNQSSSPESGRAQERQELHGDQGSTPPGPESETPGLDYEAHLCCGQTAGGTQRCDTADAGVAARVSYRKRHYRSQRSPQRRLPQKLSNIERAVEAIDDEVPAEVCAPGQHGSHHHPPGMRVGPGLTCGCTESLSIRRSRY
eukprot:5776751-Amphidinium_carterae.1